MSNSTDELFKNVISHAKEYGFVFPSSEIYDGLSAVYDYGQFGAELKNNIKTYWWKAMVQLNDNIVGIDSAIFMHPKVWEASGHVAGFADPMLDNKDSNKRYRADQLIEGLIDECWDKAFTEQSAYTQNKYDFSNDRNLTSLIEIAHIRNEFKEGHSVNLSKLTDIALDAYNFINENGSLRDRYIIGKSSRMERFSNWPGHQPCRLYCSL